MDAIVRSIVELFTHESSESIPTSFFSLMNV